MESRVHNVVGLRLADDHSLRQLSASIPCARAFSRLVLDAESVGTRKASRAVLDLNERVFRFSKRASARHLFAEHDIDVFNAVLADDERLPKAFRERRYPQMREQLAALKERRAAGWRP